MPAGTLEQIMTAVDQLFRCRLAALNPHELHGLPLRPERQNRKESRTILFDQVIDATKVLGARGPVPRAIC